MRTKRSSSDTSGRCSTLRCAMLGNYEDARDATQTAFVKAYEHLDGFDRDQRFFNWMLSDSQERVLERASRADAHRGRSRWIYPPLAAPTRWNSASVSGPFKWRYMTLSLEYREVVVLRHFTDLSYDEIAAALGIPVKTVKSRLYTARQQLGDQLSEWRVAR